MLGRWRTEEAVRFGECQVRQPGFWVPENVRQKLIVIVRIVNDMGPMVYGKKVPPEFPSRVAISGCCKAALSVCRVSGEC
jgi:hypothetical protein